MREYEITVVIKPDLEDSARDELLETVEKWLSHSEDESGKPISNHWGLRRLAYPLKGYTEGYYVYYEANLNPTSVREIEQNIQYTDEILRHLLVNKES
jgi:small subunit ribosomal protein S6